jgi:polygalacturonase
MAHSYLPALKWNFSEAAMSKLNSIFDITDFGADPAGVLVSTNAIAQAFLECKKTGGGTVFIPAGIFMTGPVCMENNTTLYISAGAKLVFIQDHTAWPVIDTRWEGSERPAHTPCIYGKGLENVTITGSGELDGQGAYWWNLHQNGGLKYPRPRFIGLEDCKRVVIEGIRLVNSPSWTINPVCCENVTIEKVSIKNPADSPNTDGINPDSSKYVHISNCHVDVGDDCITIKSGTEKSSRRISCEGITVTNCTLVHGHGGVVIGSEMSGGIRNVVISNCVFEGTDRGIRIKTRRGRGGFVEDVRISNLVMRDVMCPFVIHQFYFCGEGGKDGYVSDKQPQPVTEATPFIRRIYLSDISAVDATAAAGFIYGLPEAPVEDVHLNNITVNMAKVCKPGMPAMMDGLEPMKGRGFFCCNLKASTFNRVIVRGQEGQEYEKINSELLIDGK